MNELKTLVDLCLFQAKPQDLPYSQGWMTIAALVLSMAIFVSYPAKGQTFPVIALIAIVHVVAYGFAIRGALWYRMYPEHARHFTYLGLTIGVIGIVIALSGNETRARLGVSLVLAAGFLLVLSAILKNLAPLSYAVSRFVQTGTAILGTSAVLQLLTWPFVNWLIKARDTPDVQLPSFALLGLGIWSFAVVVNINRHAMDVTVGQSILITLGMQIFTACIVFLLFGTVML